jgi:ectoine hydroxylase-related dioxygenase (phytanoyl-CoA dioxygenase family)
MVAIDPYTSANGATVIVPDSHLWGPEKTPNRSEAVSVVMPAGSMFYFLSTLWHGGGENRSGQDRVALTVQYCQPWVRQLENQMIAVEWEKLGEMPPRLVDLLGYKVGAPFIGHVDGRSPRVAVDRILQQWQLKASKGQKRGDTRL